MRVPLFYNAVLSQMPPRDIPPPSTVVTWAGVVYQFMIDSNGDLNLFKSTNGGFLWVGSLLVAQAISDNPSISCWYDRWTPGDSGNLIHIWLCDSGVDDILYFNFDTTTDTLSSAVVVFNGASLSGGQTNGFLSGAKARGGNLYVAFDGDGGTETGFYRSVDGGANWTVRANPNEAASTDWGIVFPGNVADNQDMEIWWWDRSANELTIKSYDDSLDTITEHDTVTSMADVAMTTTWGGFSVAVRSDGVAMMAAWNSRDTGTSRLRTWTYDGTTFTAQTDVHTNIDDCYIVCLTVDANSNIWAFYSGKGDGSETLGSSVGVYSKMSADGMTTWGTEYQHAPPEQMGEILCLSAPLNVPAGFVPFPVAAVEHSTASTFSRGNQAGLIWAFPYEQKPAGRRLTGGMAA